MTRIGFTALTALVAVMVLGTGAYVITSRDHGVDSWTAPVVADTRSTSAPSSGVGSPPSLASLLPSVSLASDVNYDVIHNFGDGTVVGEENEVPDGELSEGLDHNIYGFLISNPNELLSDQKIFKATTDGTVVLVHKCKIINIHEGAVPLKVDGVTPPDCDADFYGLAEWVNGDLARLSPGCANLAIIGNDRNLYYGSYNDIHCIGAGLHWMGDKIVADYDSKTIPDIRLLQGKDGNIYATFSSGADYDASTHALHGLIIKLQPGDVDNAIPPHVLHCFGDGSVANDGLTPGGFIQASDGDLYGVTSGGGAANHGVIYKLTPDGKETILHSFGDGSVPNDGWGPGAGLLEASNGNFYGTTQIDDRQFPGNLSDPAIPAKGTRNVLFELTPSGHYRIIHVFDPAVTYHGLRDGMSPAASLVESEDGYIYGTTQRGGFSFISQNENAAPPAPADADAKALLHKANPQYDLETDKNPDLKKLEDILETQERLSTAMHDIDSKLGHGTVFRFRVPGLTGKPLAKPIEPPPPVVAGSNNPATPVPDVPGAGALSSTSAASPPQDSSTPYPQPSSPTVPGAAMLATPGQSSTPSETIPPNQTSPSNPITQVSPSSGPAVAPFNQPSNPSDTNQAQPEAPSTTPFASNLQPPSQPILDILKTSSRFVGTAPQVGARAWQVKAELDWDEANKKVKGWVYFPQLQSKKQWEGQIITGDSGKTLLEMKETAVLDQAPDSSALLGITYRLSPVEGGFRGVWAEGTYYGTISITPTGE